MEKSHRTGRGLLLEPGESAMQETNLPIPEPRCAERKKNDSPPNRMVQLVRGLNPALSPERTVSD
jgi:hypothetical protein